MKGVCMMSRKSIAILLVFASIALCTAGCAKSTPFQWNEFVWAAWGAGELHFPKAAVMVPMTIEGIDKKMYMQLDTAAGTCLNGLTVASLPNDSIKPLRQGVVSLSGQIAGLAIKNEKFAVIPGLGEAENNIIGTLGLDTFRGKALVLDFLNNQLAVVDSIRHLPDELAQRVHYIPAEYTKNNRCLIKMSIGHEELTVAYDTGASIFYLKTRESIWHNLTNRTGKEEDNTILNIPAWGQTIEIVGAPAQLPLQIADLTFTEAEVFFSPSGHWDPLFDRERFDAIIGNAPFYDCVVVLDFRGKQFGIGPGP